MGEKHVFNKRLVFRINIKYSYLVIGRKTIKKNLNRKIQTNTTKKNIWMTNKPIKMLNINC